MSTYWGIIGIAVALWFATGWYLNERLKLVHQKLDRLSDQFLGLRDYLYEIDPQFDDERQLLTEIYSETDGVSFAALDHIELEKQKKAAGYRTLNSLFIDGGHRAPKR